MADITDSVLVVVLLGALLFTGFGAVQGLNDGVADAERTVQNESITVEYDQLVEVSVRGGDVESYTNSVTIRDGDGDSLTSGNDYDWHENGTLSFTNTTATTDGEQVFISYDYTGAPQIHIDQRRQTSTALQLGVIPVLVAAVGAVLVGLKLLGMMAGSGGRR